MAWRHGAPPSIPSVHDQTQSIDQDYPKMKKLHYFQHVPYENLGIIEDWALNNGFEISSTQFYRDPVISMPDQIDWLIVMGGPMGVYDDVTCPWLPSEKQAILQAVEDGKVVLGICLGAQLIADVLGAGVRPNAYKEIGWYPVFLHSGILDHPVAGVLAPQWEAFHWHADTFDIPDGARLIASSRACRSQGFIYRDRVLGLQFHLEVTRSGAAALIDNCADDLKGDEFVSTPDKMLIADLHFEASHQLMTRLLEYLDAMD
jgi:GMP synthase (glutamine-hydrolysing)